MLCHDDSGKFGICSFTLRSEMGGDVRAFLGAFRAVCDKCPQAHVQVELAWEAWVTEKRVIVTPQVWNCIECQIRMLHKNAFTSLKTRSYVWLVKIFVHFIDY